MCPNKHDLSGLDKNTEKNENCMTLLKMSLEEEEESKPIDVQPRCLDADVKMYQI